MRLLNRVGDETIYEMTLFRKKGLQAVRETAPDGRVVFSAMLNRFLPSYKIQGTVEVEFDGLTTLEEVFAAWPEAEAFADEVLKDNLRKAMLSGQIPLNQMPGKTPKR